MPVFAANLVAWPLAYGGLRFIYASAGYGYPFHIGLPVFLAAAVFSAALTTLAVGSQTWRAASVSPVRSLRYE